MATNSTVSWRSLERLSPRLFSLAGVLLVVASLSYAVPLLLDGVSFNNWIGLTVLVGRLVSLLAIAGLSAQIANRNPRLGKLCRVVVSVAVVFTSALLTLAVLQNLGTSTPIIAVFGLGTIVLSIITYLLFGVVIARSGAYPTVIGGLLLVATGALLFGFFGQMVLGEGLVGAIAEAVLSVTSLALGYLLVVDSEPTDHADPSPESVAK